jgi:hypothetical protein
MKGKLILAEAATGHPDGTISMLRAGINQAAGPGMPFPFTGSLVVRLESDLTDMGQHQFDLRCMDMDGKTIMPPIQGGFDVPQGGGVTNLIIGIGVPIPKAGRYEFCLRVDNVVQDTWAVTASITAPPAKEDQS